MSQAYDLQGVWAATSRLKLCGKLFQSDVPLNPAQWAAENDIVNITRCPNGKFRVHNVISNVTVMCKKVAEEVDTVWRTVWEKTIEHADCVACYAGNVSDSEDVAGEVHESVLCGGGVIVTPHGWGKNHHVQLRENSATGERRFINVSINGWWPAP